MSTSVYFSKAIEKDPSKFTKTTRVERSRRESRVVTELRFLGEQVFSCAEGYYFTTYRDDQLALPEEMEREVTCCAVTACLPAYPRRARGVYRLPGDNTVEAELDASSSGLVFHARHRSVGKLYELLRLVRAGTIRPVEDWDAEQVEGASTMTLLNNELARLRLRVGQIGSRQDGFQLDLDRLRQAESDRPRPFLQKLQDRLRRMALALQTLVSRAAKRGRRALN